MAVPANNLGGFKPDILSKEVLYAMWDGSVLQRLVHTDFKSEIQDFGDSVSVNRPAAMQMRRKRSTDNVHVQNADATKVTVPLDQHGTASFMISDSDLSKSQTDLVQTYMVPAGRALIAGIEATLGAQANRFAQAVGTPGSALTSTTLLSAGAILDSAKVPGAGRNLVLTPEQYATMVDIEKISRADASGDGGAAIRNALLGDRLGFMTYKSNYVPKGTVGVTSGSNVSTTLASSASKGATTVTVASATGMAKGRFITIGGVNYQITKVDSTDLTLDRGLLAAANSGASVTSLPALDIKANLDSGYTDFIEFDHTSGSSTFPAVGQMLCIGDANYTVIARETDAYMLDRPLEAAATADDAVYVAGSVATGLAFVPEAIGFISRPLVTMPAGLGAMQSVVSDPESGLSVRMSVAYDSHAQGLHVTLDVLYGLVIFDSTAGVAIYG